MTWLGVVQIFKKWTEEDEVKAIGLNNRWYMKEVKEREVLMMAPMFLDEVETIEAHQI